jgi:Fe-S-cluster containining protein
LQAANLADRVWFMDDLKGWVIEASRRPQVRAAVRRLYADLQERIDQRRPVCVMSGRCCRFDEFGHRLYVTTAELATFVAELAQAPSGERQPKANGCAFQRGKVCTVHALRPMGCRVFFCDSTSTEWQREVYEEFHNRLKELHGELSIPYAYVEWRAACRGLGLDEAGKAAGAGVMNGKSF